MDFPGFFKDHILPDKIHILNVSFVANGIKESFGGTAGNIAYSLALLGGQPVLLGAVGNDFNIYEEWLKANKIDISFIKKFKEKPTSSCYIITDKDDNQIASFYPGPLDIDYCQDAERIENAGLAIISPELKERMVKYVELYNKIKLPYIFDPGQQITSLTEEDLKIATKGAKILIGNDYEIQLIINKLKINQVKLKEMVEILVITKGSKGSEIYNNGGKIIIPPAKPKEVKDPTGAGDAYRAGFIKGLNMNWPLEKTGRFAGLVAVYAVENYGTQAHRFSWEELEERYLENFSYNL